MDFVERQEAVTVSTVFDERRLKAGFYACDLGKIDIAAELFSGVAFEIKLFDAASVHYDDTGLFRVRRVD
jgi:hypothetical protein